MDDMNAAEKRLFMENPYLTRVPTSQKPRELEIMMPKRLNPDFKLFEPPFAGIWIEMKGHLKDAQWFPCLKAMPPWIKDKYRVVLVNKSHAQRANYQKILDGIGIHHSDFEIPAAWCEYAAGLWMENKGKYFRTELDSPLAKIAVESSSTYWEVDEHGKPLPGL